MSKGKIPTYIFKLFDSNGTKIAEAESMNPVSATMLITQHGPLPYRLTIDGIEPDVFDVPPGVPLSGMHPGSALAITVGHTDSIIKGSQ